MDKKEKSGITKLVNICFTMYHRKLFDLSGKCNVRSKFRTLFLDAFAYTDMLQNRTIYFKGHSNLRPSKHNSVTSAN